MSPVDAAALMAMRFDEPRWAVPRILPEGLSLLISKPKLGKSWWLLNVCLAVASGGRALGGIQVEQGEVLYLALEDSLPRLQRRLATILPDDEDVPRGTLALETSWPRLDNGGAQQLNDWLLDHPSTRLIAIDTLEKIRSPRKRDGTLYEQDYAAVGALKRVADDSGVAIVVSHHDRKQGATDPFDTVSGTQGLAGAADALLVMQRSRNDGLAKLHVTGRDLEEAEYAMRWSAAAGTWGILDWPVAAVDASAPRVEIIEALEHLGRTTPTRVAEWIGKPLAAVKPLMWRMAQEGLLLGGGRAGYSIQPATQATQATKSPDVAPGLLGLPSVVQ